MTHHENRVDGDRVHGRHGLSRRTFLRGAGAAVALPMLEALVPARVARAALDSPPQ